MTAVVDLDLALMRARSAVAVQDTRRDRNERVDRVRHLTSIGQSSSEIAAALGLSDRHVTRLRSAERRPDPLHVPDPRDITDERAAEVEALAWQAFEWAGALRDEDPAIVWTALSRLPRHRLQELVIVALAMVPSEATLRECLSWVLSLPAAREGVC